MGPIRKLMHIDRTDNVSVADKATSFTAPHPAFGFVLLSTSGTLATCASFGASEAQDVGLCRFVGEIVDIFAIFPQRHALVVVTTSITSAHTVRIADEKASHLMLNTEINHLSRGFVSHVPNTSRGPPAYLILGTLQLLPTAGILLAARLLLGKLAQALGALPLETANAAPGDNHGLASIRGQGGKMDFTEVHGGMNRTWDLLCLWNFHADMQLKAIVPDQGTCPARGRQVKGKHQRRPSFAHGQNDPSRLFADSLSRPHHGIEPLGSPGILHLGGGSLELPCGLYIGKESMDDHLHRLAMQGKPALGGLLQLVTSRPFGMRYACLFVGFHAQVPDVGSLLLGGFQSAKLPSRQVVKSIHAHGFHALMLAWIENVLQVEKTRYTHHTLAYHLVWIPKYRRKLLTDEVQAETKRLIRECCEHHGLTVLALETDIDHIHVDVACATTIQSGDDCQSLERTFIALLAGKVPASQESLWEGSVMVAEVLCGHSGCGVS